MKNYTQSISGLKTDNSLNTKQLLDSVLNNIEAEVVVIDSNSIIQNVNESFLKHNRLTRKEIIGRQCYKCKRELGRPCLRNRNGCPLKKVFQTSKPSRFFQLPPDNGKTNRKSNGFSEFEFQAMPIFGNNGNVEYMTEIIYPSNDSKKVKKNSPEHELEKIMINQLLEIFFTNPKNDLFCKILKYILKTMNSKYGVLGYVNDKKMLICPAISRDIWELHHFTDNQIIIPQNEWTGFWGTALKKGRAFCLNKPFFPPKRYLPIDNALIVPIAHQKEVIGILIIGDKKEGYSENERELLKTVAKFIAPVLNLWMKNNGNNTGGIRMEQVSKINNLNYEYIFNNTEQVIVTIDNAGHILECNDKMYDILGYRNDEIRGLSIFDIIPPDCLDKLKDIWDNGKIHDFNFHEECHMFRKDGSRIDVSIKSTNLDPNNGNADKKVWIIEDITDKKDIEQKLISDCDRAKVYIDILGHDIRLINNEITLSSELLLLKPNLSGQLRRYIESTVNQSHTISRLISNMHKLSDLLKDDFRLKTVDVFRVLANAIEQVKRMYPKKKVKINQGISESELLVHCNDMLEDVFINILSNAFKFDYHDEIVIDINHSLSIDGKYWRIEIKDNGPGVPNSIKEKIFNGFELENDREYGSGLGLMVVKEIITRSGGKIWVENKVKNDIRKGSNFVILLPKGLAG
jgi:PAS domain S-box-containing protein